MSTGADAKNQFATPSDGDASGGNLSGGKDGGKHTLHQPPNFMDKSGQPDNQSTDRGKGTT